MRIGRFIGRELIGAAASATVMMAAGCASAPPSTQSAARAPDETRRYTIALDLAADYRDFSRIDVVAPELKNQFDPRNDVYVLDDGLNPYNVQFTSGSTFRWSRPVDEMVRDALIEELSRSDYVRWARPLPVTDVPDFVIHVNILELFYKRTKQAYFPQVSLEALLMRSGKSDVLAKFPARLIGEFSTSAAAGDQRLHTLLVEDWMEPDLREQMRRALEKTSDRLIERMEEYLAQVSSDTTGARSSQGNTPR